MRSRITYAAAAAIGVLVLSGCATDDSSAESEGGVPFGTSKDQYIAAFETVDPIHVVAQTTGPKGLDIFSGSQDETFIAAIEEWSGGKISFDVSYAFAIAPVLEVDDALIDGRLDMAATVPSLEPSEFPVYNEFVKGMALAKDGYPIVGPLHANGFMIDVGLEVPELAQEFEDRGMHLLTLGYMSPPSAISCTEERVDADDWAGAMISANNSTVVAQLEALGATTTSLPYTEAFEALQRGAIDCTVGALSQTPATGVTEVAPHLMVAGDAAIASSPGAYAFNAGFWERLPLVAKQLFFDRAMDSHIATYVGGGIVQSMKATTMAQENGGGVVQLSGESQELIADVNNRLLAEIGVSELFSDPKGVVDLFRESSEKWMDIVVDELGYDPDLTFDELPAWLEEHGGEVDISAYVDKLNTEIMSKHRPS